MKTTSKKTAIAACAALWALLALPVGSPAAPTGGLGYDHAGLPATDGSTLRTLGQLAGRPVTFSGRLSGVRQGDTVEIQRSNTNGTWSAITRVISGPDGAFAATWTPVKPEAFNVRAMPTTATVRAANAVPTGRVAVYKPAKATWFGPGFYGKRTFCGQRMSRSLVGVAHRTLKCGTKVAFFNNGRTVVAPVVDRGPFKRGADYDLTSAAAKRLKLKQTGSVGRVGALVGG